MQLHTWQQKHAENLLNRLKLDGCAIDASDTGTGKTFIGAWVAKQYAHPLFIICPKAVIPKWTEVCHDAQLSTIGLMNVERLKRSKFVFRNGNLWTWLLPAGTLVIVDEVHQFGGINTANAAILYATRASKLPVLALSATVANSPLRLRALGFLAGLFPSWNKFWDWSLSHGAERQDIVTWRQGYRKVVQTIQFIPEHRTAQEGVQKIHAELFTSQKGFRLRSGESPGFPENRVIVERLDFSKQSDIRKAYAEIEKKVQESGKIVLTQTIELRQQIEQLRAKDLAEMVRELVEEHSVVVFLNFRESVWSLRKHLEDLSPSIIIGEQDELIRECERQKFQGNTASVCLCTFGAGGLGLDLHDLNGRPRISIINPTWSAVQLVQALGRIHRAGSLSPAVQKLIYAAGTVEEDVASRVEASLNNLSLLQDGDVSPIKGAQ
jgi:superfamily II DNA or RNA helicase